jgi:hypothetical protein
MMIIIWCMRHNVCTYIGNVWVHVFVNWHVRAQQGQIQSSLCYPLSLSMSGNKFHFMFSSFLTGNRERVKEWIRFQGRRRRNSKSKKQETIEVSNYLFWLCFSISYGWDGMREKEGERERVKKSSFASLLIHTCRAFWQFFSFLDFVQ